MTPCLRTRGLTFGYGRRGGLATPLIDSLDLEIAEGRFVGILGPNGAGKTTLLRLLTGSLAPWRGSVELFGQDIPSLRPAERARRMAFVPQESRPAFDYSVLELVLMGRAPHLGLLGIEGKRDIEIALEALEFTDVADLAPRPFLGLSAGEKQRVLLARALAQQAKVVLLDEPTAFLDLGHRHQVYGLLARLCRERGITLVAVTHELSLAGRYCDRLLLMRGGRILCDGDSRAVLTPPMIRSAYDVDVQVDHDPALGPIICTLGPAGSAAPRERP